MTNIQAREVARGTFGSFYLTVITPGGERFDLTTLRGAPVEMGAMSFTDPFSYESFSFRLPQVSMMDRPGHGDLRWMRPNSMVMIQLLRDAESGVVQWNSPPARGLQTFRREKWAQYAKYQESRRKLEAEALRDQTFVGRDPASFGTSEAEAEAIRRLQSQFTSYERSDYFRPGRPLPSTDLELENREVFLEPWWVGYIVGFDWDWSSNGSSANVSCRGWLHMLDNYLAKPEYHIQPMSYEWAIVRQFLLRPDLRIPPPAVRWPKWWTKAYTHDPDHQWFHIPSDLTDGEKFSGMLTRDTGTFTPVLTGYIQGLLSAMYTERGQWTLRMEGVQPVLQHRDHLTADGPDTLLVSLAQPGVSLSVSEDWQASANVVYGTGTQLNDIGYSGMQFTGNGDEIRYVPLAALGSVYPREDNPSLDVTQVTKEVNLQMSDALTRLEAESVAQGHLRRFARPGLTGNMELMTDVIQNGRPVSRYLIRAGDSLRVLGVLGRPGGALFHVNAVTVDFASQRVSLDLDTKFRDKLTVDEVRMRGRDALSMTRKIVAGRYQLPVSDMLFPWNSELGAGVIPSGGSRNAAPFFNRLPYHAQFPYTPWTQKYPPKDYPEFYCHIGPKSANANENWALHPLDDEGAPVGYPVLLAQSAEIIRVEAAAYDENGDVMKVPFHMSLWWTRATDYTSTPVSNTASTYPEGQFYPFHPDAWEAYNPDGTAKSFDATQPWQEGQLIQAWGVYQEAAGYWPGAQSVPGNTPTGLLVDESSLSINATERFDPYDRETNLREPSTVMGAVMFWCDQQGTKDVYFMGRLLRRPPGGN